MVKLLQKFGKIKRFRKSGLNLIDYYSTIFSNKDIYFHLFLSSMLESNIYITSCVAFCGATSLNFIIHDIVVVLYITFSRGRGSKFNLVLFPVSKPETDKKRSLDLLRHEYVSNWGQLFTLMWTALLLIYHILSWSIYLMVHRFGLTLSICTEIVGTFGIYNTI